MLHRLSELRVNLKEIGRMKYYRNQLCCSTEDTEVRWHWKQAASLQEYRCRCTGPLRVAVDRLSARVVGNWASGSQQWLYGLPSPDSASESSLAVMRSCPVHWNNNLALTNTWQKVETMDFIKMKIIWSSTFCTKSRKWGLWARDRV